MVNGVCLFDFHMFDFVVQMFVDCVVLKPQVPGSAACLNRKQRM